MSCRFSVGGSPTPAGMEQQSNILNCRFQFGPRPEDGDTGLHAPDDTYQVPLSHVAPPVSRQVQEARNTKRFQACHGSLYHQLDCSHRVRTDLVEDCGTNCLEGGSLLQFYCQDCVDREADRIWRDLEKQLNASFPSLESMTKEQYGQWYEQRSKLNYTHNSNRASHEARLKATSRPAHRCLGLEASEEDVNLATSLSSLDMSKPLSAEQTLRDRGQTSFRPRMPSAFETWHVTLGMGQMNLSQQSCGQQFSSVQSNGAPNGMFAIHEEDEAL